MGETAFVDMLHDEDCMTACTASVLGLPAGAVPDIARLFREEEGRDGEAWNYYRNWLSERGIGLMMFTARARLPPGLMCIAGGTSPRGCISGHAVVWRVGGGMLHDPHPSRAGLIGAPEDFYVLLPLRPTIGALTFDAFRDANVKRCLRWHPAGIESWSPSDWLTAVTGELGELASLLKMRNRERDGLPGNKFSPTKRQVADELADVLTYLDLLAAALGVDLGAAAVEKFNEVSRRVGFPDRIAAE